MPRASASSRTYCGGVAHSGSPSARWTPSFDSCEAVEWQCRSARLIRAVIAMRILTFAGPSVKGPPTSCDRRVNGQGPDCFVVLRRSDKAADVPFAREAASRRRSGAASGRPPDDALVLLAQQRDHVVDVRVVLDPPRAGPAVVGEDRVVDDASRREELVEDVLREAEVGGVVAVEVPDLARADLE